MKGNLTYWNIFGIAATSSILVYLFSPLLQKHRLAPKSSVETARILGQAALAYATDYDDTLARNDNNGSCFYGESPCAYPDWADLRFQEYSVGEAARVMFFGAIESYASEDRSRWSAPEIGPTDWRSVFQNQSTIGIFIPFYDPSNDFYYERTLTQPAVNSLIVDMNSTGDYLTNRPGAPKGVLSSVLNQSSKIMMTMQSAWDWDLGTKYGLGNLAVWPSSSNQDCAYRFSDGWTAYVVGAERGYGQQWYGHPDRGLYNPNLQGKATFAFVDGHVEQLTYPKSEQCVPLPAGKYWQTGQSTLRTTYYPKWVPEIP